MVYFDFTKMARRAGQNDVAGRIRPSGRRLPDGACKTSHTRSGDFLTVRLVAIWRMCGRLAMFATISRSGHRTIGRTHGRAINNDWRRSMARSIISLETVYIIVVSINDRSYDQSWPPTIDRTINRGILRPIALGIVWGET